jgi:putative transposase
VDHRVGKEAPTRRRSRPRNASRSEAARELRSRERRGVTVDETAIQIGCERFWVYAAIDADSKLLLGVRVSRCPASAFLTEPKERYDLSEVECLVDGMDHLIALAQIDFDGSLTTARET